MKDFTFVIKIMGSAKGSVKASSKAEAKILIDYGHWDDIDVYTEGIVEIENIKEIANKD